MAPRQILFMALLALAGPARAQATPDDDARATLGRFLTEGALAPFGERTREDALAAVTSEAPLAPGELAFARRGEFMASVGATGEVTFFSRSRPLLFVLGRGSARAAEVARRARFSLDDDVARARRFLADHYPAFGERRFDLTSAERCDHDALVEDELVFVERPRAGVAACWPNRIDVSLDPEDGGVTTYVATHERLESTVAPTLDADAARRALVRALGDRIRPENRAFLAGPARAELIAAPDRAGRVRTAWLIAGAFVVDAATGELLARKGASS